MKLNLEDMERLARFARISALNAVLEIMTRHQMFGNNLEDVVDDVRKALGTEMDNSSNIQIREWGIVIVPMKSQAPMTTS